MCTKFSFESVEIKLSFKSEKIKIIIAKIVLEYAIFKFLFRYRHLTAEQLMLCGVVPHGKG